MKDRDRDSRTDQDWDPRSEHRSETRSEGGVGLQEPMGSVVTDGVGWRSVQGDVSRSGLD